MVGAICRTVDRQIICYLSSKNRQIICYMSDRHISTTIRTDLRLGAQKGHQANIGSFKVIYVLLDRMEEQGTGYSYYK